MKKLYAQSITIVLLSAISMSTSFAQGVGVNPTGAAPHADALLHVDVGAVPGKGFLITGDRNISSSVPNLGPGSRLMFYPGKVAFRAGYVAGTEWDNANVGLYSVAFGAGTTASGNLSTAMGSSTIAGGQYSTAMGMGTNANGEYSTAMGSSTIAGGQYSTAIGRGTNANGQYSTAMGHNTFANGPHSTAMGYITQASGQYSIAIGNNSIASGIASIAMGQGAFAGGDYSTAMGHTTFASAPYSMATGYLTTASGQNSTAIGYNSTASGVLSVTLGTNVATNSKRGSFFFGDGDPNLKGVRLIGFADQFAARFNGGYYFISSDAGADIGVQVLAGGNAWVAMCDENRKENFEPLDGEDVLNKMKVLKFSSWNYKTQDPAIHRHYGIMAQDFYNAFGNDKYGKIGNDSTVNPIDMIGIDMAAIQALEKRTAQLTLENMQLKNEMNELKRRLDKMESRN